MESMITDRRCGIELEFLLPIIGLGQNLDVQQLVAELLTSQGLPSEARGYTKAPISQGRLFAVEHDSSLRDESRFGGAIRWAKLELKSAPMSFRELERVLPKALEIVNFLGPRCNSSCGYHAHWSYPEIASNPRAVASLLHLWWRAHELLYGMVAPSRRTSSYCRPPTFTDATRFDKVRTYDQLCRELRACERYMGLNLCNLLVPERKTIEFRVASSTTQWSKVRSWLLLTHRITEHSLARSCHLKRDPMPNTRAGLNQLFVVTGLKQNSHVYSQVDKELREAARFLVRRWKHFNLPRDLKSGNNPSAATVAA